MLSAVIIALWQYGGNTNSMVRLLLSSPSHTIQYFSENYTELLRATGITLLESVLGLIIAVAFSFTMMILCFFKPKFMEFILPVMIISQVIPLIVLAPFFIIFLGIGLASKIAMAAVISFFPIFINFTQGYKSISKNIHELMTVCQASVGFRIRNVYFPLSMPNILAGLKVSATLSVIGAIVAEFSGANTGLGKNLFISALRLEPDLMMCSLILSTLIGLSLFGIIRYFEKKYINWL